MTANLLEQMSKEERQRLAIKHWVVQNLDQIKESVERDCESILGVNNPIDIAILQKEFGFIGFDEFVKLTKNP